MKAELRKECDSQACILLNYYFSILGNNFWLQVWQFEAGKYVSRNLRVHRGARRQWVKIHGGLPYEASA
jgi:hypothetical protein